MNKSLGQEIIEAVDEALEDSKHGRVVRPIINVKELRHNLHLTQREFSTQYHISIETLRNWEQEKRMPDLTSLAFLTCIEKNPKVIAELLNS